MDLRVRNNGNKQPAVVSVPKYPSGCCILGCENDTHVAIMLAETENGRQLADAASEFSYTKGTGENSTTIMKDRYKFKGWITRCAEHYLDDVVKAKRNAGQYPGTHG